MTVHAPKLLTPEEFASLIEVAIASPIPAIPAPHLAKLITLGYVVETAKGPVVTGGFSASKAGSGLCVQQMAVTHV